MLKKTVSGILLTLLLIGTLVLAFEIQPVKASGTIYIWADGSIDPPTAPIQREGDMYVLTGNITSMDPSGPAIAIERDGVTLDGAGYTLRGPAGDDPWGDKAGVKATRRQNLTIKNMNIRGFYFGVWLYLSSYNTLIFGNRIANNSLGIWLDTHWESSNNSISENAIINNGYGILLEGAHNSSIVGNNIADNSGTGIRFDEPQARYSTIVGNSITGNGAYGIELYGNNNSISGNVIAGNAWGGIDVVGSGCNNISGNVIANNGQGGITIAYGYSNNISGNSIANNGVGIGLFATIHDRVVGNNITGNSVTGIDLDSWGVFVFHNNFFDNTQQAYSAGTDASIWDDGYPYGGNYWSDYTDIDLNNDGIWDHPYVIDQNNQDNYPLVNPWTLAPTDQPPTCMIKLEKDGLDISRIDVSEFFDIDVEGSTDDNGILKVRFSNDDVRDGNPTGLWTQWYDWSISASDWDATTKIRRWAFYTSGYKEVWAEVMDSSGQTARCSANIYVPAPALPVLISPMVISPSKDAYSVGDALTAEFTVKNIGELPITLDKLTVGGRLNGWIQADGYPDFTYQSVTLQAGETYQYTGSLILTQIGNYHFFVTYYIANPTSEERKLLDKNYWNTCVELGDGLTQSDRVKELIVFSEGVVPEEVSQLRDKITQELMRQVTYPPYLLDPDSFKSSVATLWLEFTSWATQTDLTERYDELYNTGVDYQSLRIKALHDAHVALDSGDFLGGQKYLRKSYTYDRLSMMSFSSAAQLFDGMAEAAETLAQGVKDGCEVARQLAELALKITNPAAAKTADYIFLGVDYAVDYMLLGQEEATKNLVIQIAVKTLFEELNFDELGGKTISDYTNNRIGKITFPILQKIFEDDEGSQFLASKIIQESGVAEETAVYWVQSLYDLLKKGVDLIQEVGKSPIEIRIHDSSGRTTGLSARTVSHEIPMSTYYNGTITIFFPSDSYVYELEGKDNGVYGLEITQTQNGTTTCFNATNIPISVNATHVFTTDWTALSRDEEGVGVKVDSDGDGVFEYTFASGRQLTHDQFILQTTTTIDFKPDTLNLISQGKWITCYIELPEGYNVSDIDVSKIMVNGTIPIDLTAPMEIGDYDGDGIPDLMVNFNRTAVAEFILSKGITIGNVTLTVTGQLNDGTPFEGSNRIIVSALAGDVNCDGTVDIIDVILAAASYGTREGDTDWNPNANFAPSWNQIDILDIVTITYYYGQTLP